MTKLRAVTPEMKREIVERILAAWEKQPMQRLGQLIENARIRRANAAPLFHIEDAALADMVEAEAVTA